MTWEYPVIILLGGLVASDTTSGPQLLISEPVVACTILGHLFGVTWVGFLFGIFMQFLWFGYMPLGAAKLLDGNMGSYIATASVLGAGMLFGFSWDQYRAAFVPALLYSGFVGFVGEIVTTKIRHRNSYRSELLTDTLEREQVHSIGLWHIRGLGLSYLRGAGMTCVMVPVGVGLLSVISVLPGGVVHCLSYASFFMWGAVAAFALMFYWLKGRHRYLALGMSGGIIWLIVTELM